MGTTDDLEEFDAELEIALKREYKTVFPLFRYCVITAEATYLCNQLQMDCVPHSSYILFEIRMEDVWVWDRNRPTRIIPKAQIYTTADVTVEQLRDEDGVDLDASLPPSVIEQLRAGLLADDGELDDELEVEDETSAPDDVRGRETPDDMVGGATSDD